MPGETTFATSALQEGQHRPWPPGPASFWVREDLVVEKLTEFFTLTGPTVRSTQHVVHRALRHRRERTPKDENRPATRRTCSYLRRTPDGVHNRYHQL